MKKINVVGLGYIGLPTALMFASHGVEIVGTDYNQKLVDTLNSGRTTFKEDGLDDLFKDALSKNIKFSTEYISTDMYIISVPTPYEKENKKIDASYVVSAVNSVLDICPKGAIIVVESTVSPGTMDRFVRPVITERGFKIGEDVHLVHAPERIIPGNMVYELEYNSRTIGADSKEIGVLVKDHYATFCKGDIVVTDIKTAEMTKVVENTFRDINIAFANELAKICRSDNMDVYEIIKIANKHPRVNILSPGPGVGGHCISVDPWFLVGDYPALANLIWQARKINDSMPEFVIERIYHIMKEHNITDNAKVGIYGLTYKENVDDVRESPGLQLMECLEHHMSHGIKVYDPYVEYDMFENQYHDFDKFINDVELVVVLTGHDEIKQNQDKLKNKIVLDTRKVCNEIDVYTL